ncbi:MAG: hypothetical protein KIT16_08520 [Rhodospirillaceae bacterium]|nr:hypothetical protein [Rhodospirillaceae bacterium]
MRFATVASLLALAVFGLVAPAAAEVCLDRGPGQYTSNHTICASSVLAPQGGNTYGPDHLDGDTATAWCEGAPGDGRNEYLRIAYSKPVRFKSVLIGNGYAKSRTAYFPNARARTVRIETGDGIRIAAELPDRGESHEIRLPRIADTTSLRVTIVDTYPGDKHQDLCLFHFTPNFEAMDREN